ncbi:hypothetical protein QEH53_01455 [Pelagicoccus sp. SDUM812002]|nr:hypothetical protein [Pelagicoccus sp. SDUM812002]MDQ8184223.1 hypothetical protein [Pelagicoccus sp. SDUM812002]
MKDNCYDVLLFVAIEVGGSHVSHKSDVFEYPVRREGLLAIVLEIYGGTNTVVVGKDLTMLETSRSMSPSLSMSVVSTLTGARMSSAIVSSRKSPGATCRSQWIRPS